MLSKRIISSITSIALCMSFMVPSSVFAAASFTGGASISGGLNVPVAITDLQVTGAGAEDIVPVFLYVPNGSLEMTTTTGLTFTGGTSGQRLYFSGTLTDVNTALTTLQYIHGSAGTFTLEASIIGPGQIYDPSTQHMYEVVNNGSPLTANDARTAALARSTNGVNGYLANITSSDENAFVAARITEDGWFGASDESVEGDWAWRDGPEAGTVFWIGAANGASQNGAYENWANDEPNQSGEEDCSQFYANGSGWNDLPCNSANLDYYVVEYGAPGNLPNIASDTLDISLSADVTQTPTLTSPISDSTQNTLQLTYSLPEVPTAGTVNVSFNNGTTTTTLTMSNSQSVNTAVNLGNLASSNDVTSATASSLADGTYTVTLSYQDALGNPASTDVASVVIIDTIAPTMTLTLPTTSSTINNVTTSSSITFSTNEALASGSITITRTGGTADPSSPHVCILKGTGLNTGSRTIDLADNANGCVTDVSDLVSGGVYTFTLSGADAANNTGTNSTTNITFDNIPPVLTPVTPIASQTTIENAIYHFTTSEVCEYLAEAPLSTLGDVEVTIDPSNPGQNLTARLTGIQVGGTYSFGFVCRNSSGSSNLLEVGPFTVINTPSSGGGGGGRSIHYGCTDSKATNYKAHGVIGRASLCEYATTKVIKNENVENKKPIQTTTIVSEKLTCKTAPFLTRPIRLGSNNDPEDVKLLEKFLNTFENTNLPIDGFYSKKDFDAVVAWQEKYIDDILKPWGLTKGTGYVFTTSLKKIKELQEKICINTVLKNT